MFQNSTIKEGKCEYIFVFFTDHIPKNISKQTNKWKLLWEEQ